MNVNFSSDAEQDLIDGFWFYEFQEQGTGTYFKTCLLEEAERLRITGGTHSVHGKFHRALSKNFPFSLYYRLDNQDSLTIVAILDQRQRPSKIRRALDKRA